MRFLLAFVAILFLFGILVSKAQDAATQALQDRLLAELSANLQCQTQLIDARRKIADLEKKPTQ